MPSDRVPALLKWTHESSGHVGADCTLRLFKQWFHTTWTDDQLRKPLQPIVDKCPLCCGGHHCRILGKREFFLAFPWFPHLL